MAAMPGSSCDDSNHTAVSHTDPPTQRSYPALLSVRLPDLFSDIMNGAYNLNSSYNKVKPKADAWIEQ